MGIRQLDIFCTYPLLSYKRVKGTLTKFTDTKNAYHKKTVTTNKAKDR